MKAPSTPGKKPYPFGWPTGKPSREQRQPKKKWKRRKAEAGGLTATASPAHNGRAFDALRAGRGNPILLRRTSANRRALFVCPVLHYGGLGGAGSRLAGSLTPVFHPRSSRRPTAVESGRVGSIHLLRSHPMKTPTQATPEIHPNPAQSPATGANVLTLDAIARLAATDKPKAFEWALLGIQQGNIEFTREVVANAVAFRETLDYARAITADYQETESRAALGKLLEQCGGIVRLLQNDSQSGDFGTPHCDVRAALRGIESLLEFADAEHSRLCARADIDDGRFDRLGCLIEECGGVARVLLDNFLPGEATASPVAKVFSALCALESLLALARENLARVATTPAEGAGRGQAAKEGGL